MRYREVILPKWLADKKGLPTSIIGEIERETEKAILLTLKDDGMVCAYAQSQYDDPDYDPDHDPCQGCLDRDKCGFSRGFWLPKSQIEIKLWSEPLPEGIRYSSPGFD